MISIGSSGRDSALPFYTSMPLTQAQSIAEAALGGSPLQCWDNSTRGLDSATALEFVKTLRISTRLGGSTAIVAIYQASQSIYDVSSPVALIVDRIDSTRYSTKSPCSMKEGRYISATKIGPKSSLKTWDLIVPRGKRQEIFSPVSRHLQRG